MKINTINSHEAVGRTIASVREEGRYAFLVMTDGSVLPVEAARSLEDEPGDVVVGDSLSDEDIERIGRDCAVQLGLVSAEDFDRHTEEKQARYRDRRDLWERAEFERLSKKFGRPEAK